jgi:hypothetical protein
MAKIELENRAGIDIEKKYLEDLNSYANLPDGKVLLVLNDSPLPKNNQGVCVASQLRYIDPEYDHICRRLNSSSWDCCVIIANKWCMSRNEFPAYFTYLLGHELGHAYICLSDITLHIHCCLIHLCIKSASKNKFNFPHELPNEKLFDQFGKYLSQKFYSLKKLDREIDILHNMANNIEKKCLEQIKTLSPLNNFNELRDTIINFSKPFKNELIECWKHDASEAINHNENSLTHLISDYDKIFEA